MQVSKPIAVNKDELFHKADELNAERVAKIAQKSPTMAGSGNMPKKINEMVVNMKELHAKALELVGQSSDMLSKYGYAFEETDEKLASICKSIK